MNALTAPGLHARADLARRFGGMARLYGDALAQHIAQAHVCVVGVGGVGSWVAECLARSNVGVLTLIDLDNVAESNFNRQLHALTLTLGMPKVAALGERIGQINPACKLRLIEEFITPENIQILMPQCHAVIDCTDHVHAKAALAVWCKARQIGLVMCGAAGGKRDAARLQVADLSLATHDPLLAAVRTQLRRDHGFAKAAAKPAARPPPMQVCTVFSPEAVQPPAACNDPQGLSCAGYGSAMHVTATMGLLAAGHVINQLARGQTCG
jgi:tRNA threonylcarbamoyladenosine dehydratase